jgi:hypothetical protein
LATPIFDQQIIRLRRRLGDIYNEARVEITIASIATLDGEVWSRAELVDIYNMAVHSFMDYMVSKFKKSEWYEYMPGYIRINPDIAVVSNVVDLTALTPPFFAVLDMRIHNSTALEDTGVEVSPDDFFSSRVADNTVRDKSLQYTVLAGGTSDLELHLASASTIASIDLIYLKTHEYINHADASDLPRITEIAKDRILLLAEMEARKHKQEDISDIPEARQGQVMQQDEQRLSTRR